MARHFQISASDVCYGVYDVTAENFEDAVKRIQQGHWDDYNMTKVSGEETWNFELIKEWEDPESVVDSKDNYDRNLVDVMEDENDEKV